MSILLQDTTYAGEALNGFITELTTGFDTTAKGLMHIVPNIKKAMAIPRLRVDAFIQAPADKPVHSGEIDIDKRELVPEEIMGYLEFHPKTFEGHWAAVQMNPKLLDRALPHTAEAAISSQILKQNAQWMDTAVWQSVKDPAAVATALANGLSAGDNTFIFFDGLIKKLQDDADVIKVTSPAVLTEANILAKFKEVKAEVPKALKQNQKLKYLVSYNTAEIYENAQQGQNYKGANITDSGKMTFGGKQIVPLAGVPDDTIIAVHATADMTTNLWLGVNAVDEDQMIKLDKVQNNSELWFYKMLMKIDVNHAQGNEIVLYTV